MSMPNLLIKAASEIQGTNAGNKAVVSNVFTESPSPSVSVTSEPITLTKEKDGKIKFASVKLKDDQNNNDINPNTASATLFNNAMNNPKTVNRVSFMEAIEGCLNGNTGSVNDCKNLLTTQDWFDSFKKQSEHYNPEAIEALLLKINWPRHGGRFTTKASEWHAVVKAQVQDKDDQNNITKNTKLTALFVAMAQLWNSSQNLAQKGVHSTVLQFPGKFGLTSLMLPSMLGGSFMTGGYSLEQIVEYFKNNAEEPKMHEKLKAQINSLSQRLQREGKVIAANDQAEIDKLLREMQEKETKLSQITSLLANYARLYESASEEEKNQENNFQTLDTIKKFVEAREKAIASLQRKQERFLLFVNGGVLARLASA